MKLILVVVLLVLTSCGQRAKPDAKWQGPYDYHGGQKYWLVCNQSGKVIAEINTGGRPSDTWSVFGGNGAGYGEYTVMEQARTKAEQIVVDGSINHELLQCP